MTFDPMSVEVTCVTLPKDHCVQVPWQYINVCGYSDQFCKIPHTCTYTYIHTHTTYRMSDHIVSYELSSGETKKLFFPQEQNFSQYISSMLPIKPVPFPSPFPHLFPLSFLLLFFPNQHHFLNFKSATPISAPTLFAFLVVGLFQSQSTAQYHDNLPF